jgi:hypothetical protein
VEKETGKKNKKLKKIPEFDQEISVEKMRTHEDGESESDEDDIVPPLQQAGVVSTVSSK